MSPGLCSSCTFSRRLFLSCVAGVECIGLSAVIGVIYWVAEYKVVMLSYIMF